MSLFVQVSGLLAHSPVYIVLYEQSPQIDIMYEFVESLKFCLWENVFKWMWLGRHQDKLSNQKLNKHIYTQLYNTYIATQ